MIQKKEQTETPNKNETHKKHAHNTHKTTRAHELTIKQNKDTHIQGKQKRKTETQKSNETHTQD